LRIFKGKQFGRWASREGIGEDELRKTAEAAFAGRVDADLGGYLFKMRIARGSGGKSGGYRTILGFRKLDSERIFFLYGFPKNVRANITTREHLALSATAAALVHLTDAQIEALKTRGAITELEDGT
jgi:hypothetical protein